jgi:hypothetical protein
MERTHQLLVKKFTLLIDPEWEKELIEKFYNHVEAGEVFQLLDEESIEICSDCQVYLTKEDKEVIMDVYRCDQMQQYCLNCCGCEDHDITEEGPWY